MPSMSLKSTVRGAIFAVAVGSAVIVAAMIGAYLILKKTQDDFTFATAVSADMARLNLLTSELIFRQSPRVFTQWKRQHEILTGRLAFAPGFGNHGDILVAELDRRMERIKQLFDRVESSFKPETGGFVIGVEARDILFSSLIGQSGALHSRTLELGQLTAETADQVGWQMFLTIGAGVLLALILGGALMSMISHGLLSRILGLREVIQELSSGNLDAEIPLKATDEMGDVFRELHQMRLNLLQSIGEYGRVNLELIGAKAALEDRVAERTAGLEAANRELEAFTYAVSHDLRAPLRTISGFSQAVLEDYSHTLDEDGQTMLRRVHRATGQMGQLIEDMLKLSRINRAAVDVGAVDMSAMVEEIGQSIRERMPDRSVRLTVQPDVQAQGDERLLAIVMTNLLENSWKYSSENPDAAIEFGAYPDGGRMTYFIKDNGAGFDMAYSEKLFKPFQRLHTAERFPGTGIGLATVARVIGLHGGRIWAHSEPGQGAKFFFQLGTANTKATSRLNDDDAATAAADQEMPALGQAGRKG